MQKSIPPPGKSQALVNLDGPRSPALSQGKLSVVFRLELNIWVQTAVGRRIWEPTGFTCEAQRCFSEESKCLPGYASMECKAAWNGVPEAF